MRFSVDRYGLDNNRDRVSLERFLLEHLDRIADAINVNEHSALIVDLGETLPAAEGSILAFLMHERRSGAADRLWWCRYNAVGTLELFELSAAGGAGGDSILINAVAVIDANFNNTTPAAVGTGRNVFFQRSGTAPDLVSAYMNQFTAALAGIVPLSGGGVVNFLRADGTWAPAGAPVITSVTVTPPYGSREFLATITDAAVGAGSKPMLYPGIYAQTDTNTPEDVDSHVESVAVGSFTLRMIARGLESFGGPFKFQYLLG